MDVILTLIEDSEEKKVYATMRSISGAESSNARLNDIKPSCMFLMWAAEYDGQHELKCNGLVMTVYRTYMLPNGRIELYTEKRAGRR